jgi:pimeloyl-ACP methyl ester carboxylesterase
MTSPPSGSGSRFRTPSGVELAYDLRRTGSERLVIVSHGIFGHRRLHEIQRLSEFLAERFDVLIYDCRGHGDSTGRFSFGMQEWRDLAALTEGVGGDYRAVGGLGFSFGGFHTCIAAARTRCFDAVMLVSAPKDFRILDHNPFGPGLRASFRLMLQRSRRRTRLSLVRALGPRTMPIACVADIRVPVHIVHGDQDWVVHVRHARAMFEKAWQRRELTVLPGGLHAEYLIEQMPDEILPLIRNWFDRVL